MGFHHITAEEIRRTLLIRINTGHYAVGSRIPPARVLADEFGANRNTISKAFQELARDGFVNLIPGRGGGTFVQRADSPADTALDHLGSTIRPLIEQARIQGLSKGQVRAVFEHALESSYGSRDLQIKFLECNVHDAHNLVEQLQPLVGCRMYPGVIEQENMATLGSQYDLVVTTFHHLAEVTRALAGTDRKVIGVNAVPTADVALKIALLEGTRLGLVCGRENTAQSMKHLVASYHPDDTLDVALVTDGEAVRMLARESEALIVTYSCADAVAELTDRVPDVVIEFQIDGQSVEFLRQYIARLQTQHAPGSVQAGD